MYACKIKTLRFAVRMHAICLLFLGHAVLMMLFFPQREKDQSCFAVGCRNGFRIYNCCEYGTRLCFLLGACGTLVLVSC
jgi:hypothetical protein